MLKEIATWQTQWLDHPLFAYVEQRDDAGSNDHTAPIILDVMRQDSVLPHLVGGHSGALAETIGNLGTAQIVIMNPDARLKELSELVEGSWHQIKISKVGEYEATLYRDLAGEEVFETRISLLPSLDEKLRVALGREIGLNDIPFASFDDLEKALQVAPELVAVYNVGQGNCNAVCDEMSTPILYFDLGGGCLANSRTYPPKMDFCFSKNPAVILSHWDFDHWFSAEKTSVPPHVRWIAPKQSIGPRTLKFAKRLAGLGTLRLWPPSVLGVSTGPVSIVRCSGTSKNDSGLAMYVDLGRGGAHNIVLCPADAAFNCLPSSPPGRRRLSGLVATHHGSAHVGSGLPRPAKEHLLAYSFGAGNTYRHPRPAAQAAYLAAGWANARATPAGHIALGAPKRPIACAGSSCTLTLVQP